MPNLMRALLAMVTALLLTAVPIATVSACSCAMSDFNQAVGEADVAFVGRPISVEAAPRNDIGETVLTTWEVERSRDPIPAGTVAIRSWSDSGANCGISFATDERWMVLAYASEGALETNGCMQNRRLDGSDPDGEATIASLLPVVATPTAVEDEEFAIPLPVVGVAAATLLLVAVSLLAFRRQRG
jgi:hypothetical protein